MPTPARLCALAHAQAFDGVAEQPPGSNRGPLIDQWNLGAGVPAGSEWCMSFMHAMFKLCGVDLGGGASVGNFRDWAQAHGELVRRPLKGDCVCFEWETDTWPDHVGIVERVLALRWWGNSFTGWIRYIAGNDGDRVARRWRWISRPGVPGSAQFVRVPG